MLIPDVDILLLFLAALDRGLQILAEMVEWRSRSFLPPGRPKANSSPFGGSKLKA